MVDVKPQLEAASTMSGTLSVEFGHQSGPTNDIAAEGPGAQHAVELKARCLKSLNFDASSVLR